MLARILVQTADGLDLRCLAFTRRLGLCPFLLPVRLLRLTRAIPEGSIHMVSSDCQRVGGDCKHDGYCRSIQYGRMLQNVSGSNLEMSV
jgi:hypothetical protein